MNTYEILIDEYKEIKIKEIDLGNSSECGYYSNNKIVINNNMTIAQKRSILIEELGHHFTSYGDIRDQSKIINRKQELKARRWGYEKLVSIKNLVQAHEYGCKNSFEMADHLNVTIKFLEDTIRYYKEKYDSPVRIDNYTIYFHPEFGVLKMFE